MKNIIYRSAIITLFCISLICNYFAMTEHAFGGDNSVEYTRQAGSYSRLIAGNTAGNSGYISEEDIIIIVDEPEVGSVKKVETVIDKEKSSLPDKLVSEYLKDGNKFEARNELSDLYFAETDSAKKIEIKNKLDELNAELVFSKAPSPDAVFYVVQPGDTLINIASKHDTNYEFIMRINKKPRTNIRVGERLKIPKGKLTILVDKSDFTLTLLLNGRFIKQYPVGIGVSDKTPEGVFVVDNKLINPVWYSPEGIYPYGDPRNVLGTRWIGFEDKKGLYGYGIHGTTEPESIGRELSNGCVRLRNEDVEELFDLVKPRTTVVIQK